MSEETRRKHFSDSVLGTKAAEGAAVDEAGALTGGLLGTLVGYGIPEETAREYERGIREGGIVLIVVPRSEADADYLENEWRGSRGEAICR
jgi:hypothetical protein